MKKTGTAAQTPCFELFHAAKRNSGWNCGDIQGCQWKGGGDMLWEEGDNVSCYF